MPNTPDQSKLALAFSVGTVVSSSIIGGIVVGFLLDRWLKTSPWLLLAGILLGSTGAFAALYRIIVRLNEK